MPPLVARIQIKPLISLNREFRGSFFFFRLKMNCGDIDELARILANTHVADPSAPEKMLRAFNGIKGMLNNITGILTHDGFQRTNYLDLSLYTELPNTYYVEMDLPIKLDLPNIRPVQSSNGLIYLKALNISDSNLGLLSIDGFIRSDCFKHYVTGKFNNVVATALNGWSLQFIHGRHGHCQTIEGKSELATVYINLIPVLEFQGSQWPLAVPPVDAAVRSKFPWFAVPWQSPVNKDNRAFTVYAPFWLTQALSQFPNCVQFLNLVMTYHAKRARDFPNFSVYMLKSFMLRHVLNNGDVALQEFISIMPELMVKLNNGILESVLMGGHNMLECMSFGDLQECMATLKDLWTEAQYDNHGFWIGLLHKYPTIAFWFAKYFAVYSHAN